MIVDKLKELLKHENKTTQYLSSYFGISIPAIRNKFSRGSFSATDLIIIAEALGYELVLQTKYYDKFDDLDGYSDHQVIFSTDDLSDRQIEIIQMAKVKNDTKNKRNLIETISKMSPEEQQKYLEFFDKISEKVKEIHNQPEKTSHFIDTK